LKDPDHYTGAENDVAGKLPSRELLEAAAEKAGFTFEECISLPLRHRHLPSKEHEELQRKLLEILKLDDATSVAIAVNVETFHQTWVRGKRKRRRKD
jgi:hypothetical protein